MLVKFMKMHRKLAGELLDEIEVLHEDGISAVQRKLEDLSQSCPAERERLTQKRRDLLADQANLTENGSDLQLEVEEIAAKLERSKKISKNVGIGVGFGVAGLGLSLIFPPAAVVIGVASNVAIWTGVGVNAVDT